MEQKQVIAGQETADGEMKEVQDESAGQNRNADPETAAEQEHLEWIERCLAERIAGLNEELEEGEKDVEDMHDYYWQNYTEMDEYGYENFDNQQALLQQVSSNNAKLDLKYRLRRMQDSPYFGRVDFLYEGEETPEPHYIGIAGFSKKDGAMPLIFDWRAPVSGLFYDFEKGEASYEAPGGKITGEVTAKWQYKIRRGRMVYAVESDLKIDDDILKQELSSNGDVSLKNIVRTIQKEQNQIIRNTKDRILVVQGAAGSGKTSVALHRVAYLLYHDRKSLKANEILILSPNQVFSSYISHILPELGEENIREMSFDYFAWKELRETAGDCEDCYDQLERVLERAGKQAVEKTASGGVVLAAPLENEDRKWDKQSKEFIEELRGFLLNQEDALVTIRDISYKKLQKTEAQLNELFYFKFPDIPLFRRMEAVMEYVTDEAETLAGKDFDDGQKEKIRQLFDSMYETRDIYVLYSRFLESMGLEPLPEREPKDRVIPYEDLYPMLYMKYELEGAGNRRRVRHLVIDEMQDYSYVQYLILAKLFPCRMTIVGDRCQTMGENRRDVMRFLPSVLGKDIRMLSIEKSYRNTAEIADYAQQLIGTQTIENLGRHGKKPEELAAAGMREAAELVLDRCRTAGICGGRVKEGVFERAEDCGERTGEERFETSAVICMTMEEAREIYGLLKEYLGERADGGTALSLIDKNSETFRPGLAVTTFYLAKGLEFDQVFQIYRSCEWEPVHCQARYIAATRALHELYVIERQT